MANTKFATMWRLIDSNKKLQNTFISALDQFIDCTRQNQSIHIQLWVDDIAPDTLTQNADRPVPRMVSALPKSRSTGRYKWTREHRQVVRTQLPLSVIRTKSCSFCRQSGHSLGMRCIKISTWKGTLLTRNKNKTSQRDELVKQLRNPGSAYSIEYLPIDKYNLNAINEIGSGQKRWFFMHDMLRGII